MKKILIVAVLCIGFFSMSNAQTLNYRINNLSTTNTYSFTIDHNGTAPSAVETGIPAPGVRSGTIGSGASTFALGMEMTAANSSGCYGSAVTDNPGSGSIPIVCPQSAYGNYRLTENIPFVLYTLEVRLN